MRVLVIGTAEGCEPQAVVDIFKFTHGAKPITEIVHLDDSLASELAAKWGVHNNVTVIPKFPNWDKDFKWSAALNRDIELFSGDLYPDMIIAFPGGKWTTKLIKIAKEFGVKPIVDFEENFLDLKAKPIELRS